MVVHRGGPAGRSRKGMKEERSENLPLRIYPRENSLPVLKG